MLAKKPSSQPAAPPGAEIIIPVIPPAPAMPGVFSVPLPPPQAPPSSPTEEPPPEDDEQPLLAMPIIPVMVADDSEEPPPPPVVAQVAPAAPPAASFAAPSVAAQMAPAPGAFGAPDPGWTPAPAGVIAPPPPPNATTEIEELADDDVSPASVPPAPPPPPRKAAKSDIEVDVETTFSGEDATPDITAEVVVAAAPPHTSKPPPAPPPVSKPQPPPPPPVAATPPPAAAPPPPPAAAATPAATQQRPASKPTAESNKKRGRPWWEELFDDDFLRSMERMSIAQVARDSAFIEDRLGLQRGAVVLDLCCGAGKHAVELTRRGYKVVGYDLSLAMLARASDEAEAAQQKINFLHGDMRDMAFEAMFDGVYCWNTSFGYFEEDKNVAVIQRVFRALRPGGVFLLDVCNRDFIVQRQPNLVWFMGEGCICMDETSIDSITSRLKVKRTVMLDDGRTRELEYSVRLYGLHELGKILHDCGFKILEVTGHIATPGVYFGAEAPRCIILAERS